MKYFPLIKYYFLLIFLRTVAYRVSQVKLQCVWHHWKEDEAILTMKEFASTWNDRISWESRSGIIRKKSLKVVTIESYEAMKVFSAAGSRSNYSVLKNDEIT